MTLSVNGREKEVHDGSSLTSLLSEMSLETERKGIALCVNLEVIPKEHWDSTILKDNDRIEIVIAAPGG
ncbi:MAG: sulfur carrier protein ThiS [Lentisphaeraceae bacterium]|nr:sulfur carrier protein ThiS [Lentisphaeraceae bacterium]